jgi:FkbM family methyltransferase
VEPGTRLANLLLRFAPSLGGLRRVPVLGDFLSWTSRKLVPRESLLWVQIQHGPSEGLWIRVNPRTGQDVQHGIGEPQVQRALSEYLHPGMTFYDVGANIGFFSLMAARLVGPQGRVVAFEADPEIAARLRENLARNQFPQAQVEQKAVWSKPATVAFERIDPNTSPDRGLGHVSLNGSAPGSIMVEAVSLDQYIASHPPPDFLKCDVEGAEVTVFQGAGKLLSAKRPILLVEMHSPENHRVLLDQFATHGYRSQNLDDNHVLAFPQ